MNAIRCTTYFDFLDNLRDSGRINMIVGALSFSWIFAKRDPEDE